MAPRKEVRMEFANWLREEMRVRRMGQSELSRLTGVGQPMINRWIMGRYNPSANSVFAVAKGLGVDPEFVLELAGHSPRQKSPESTDLRQIMAQMRYIDWTRDGRLSLIKGILATYQAEDRIALNSQGKEGVQRLI